MFLCESSLCSTVDLTQNYFNDHREIIYTLKRTGELNLYQMSSKLDGQPQHHVLKNDDKWLLNPNQE